MLGAATRLMAQPQGACLALPARQQPLQRSCAWHLTRRSSSNGMAGGRQQQRRGAVAPVTAAAPAAAAAAGVALLTPGAVFDAATVLVLPFYAAMIAAPGARFTQRLFSTPALLALAGALYGLLLLAWNPLPQLSAVAGAAADAVRSAAGAGAAANAWRAALPSMPAFAALFSSGQVTALAWVHLVLLDLVQAR